MADEHRALAARFFNEVWGLLGKADRSAEDDLQMVHLAHASRLHWHFAGAAREWAIGEWQIARVYAALGRGEPALFHAGQALRLTEGGRLGAFLEGCAEEVMARACRAAGQGDQAALHRAKATAIAVTLTDPEERELLDLDLADAR